MTLVANPQKKIDKKLKDLSPSLESFEETYKTAYSHGLEEIYSLENVDLKTVRKIEPKEPAPTFPKSVTSQNSLCEPSQLEFDYGPHFRQWIKPLFLQEPIEVLKLTSKAQAFLQDQKIKKLCDLLYTNFKDDLFQKGMGQGFIDEVQDKLKEYVGEQSLEKTGLVNFKSLVLSLSSGLSFKKLHLFLETYNLAEDVPLSHIERIERKSLKHQQQEEWNESIWEGLYLDSRQREAKAHLKMIFQAFIYPWMQKRSGIVTQLELLERLENISQNPEQLENYRNFIETHFTEGKFIFSDFLFEPEKKIYCCNQSKMTEYQDIIATIQSYFYRSNVIYFFDELQKYLLKEFAMKWKDYSVESIRRILIRSKFFQVTRKNSDLLVSLA